MTECGLKEREERGHHCQSTATKANKAGDKSNDQSHTHIHSSLPIEILSSNPQNDRSLRCANREIWKWMKKSNKWTQINGVIGGPAFRLLACKITLPSPPHANRSPPPFTFAFLEEELIALCGRQHGGRHPNRSAATVQVINGPDNHPDWTLVNVTLGWGCYQLTQRTQWKVEDANVDC